MRFYLTILSMAAISCSPNSTESEAEAANLRAFVDAYYDDYLRDGVTIDTVLEYYSEDVEFVDPTFQIEVHGHDGLRQLYGAVGTQEFNYTNLNWDLDIVLAEGNQVAVNGRWTGSWHNCPFDVPFVTIFDVENGLITRQQDFFAASMFDDQVGLEEQTGLPSCDTNTADGA